MARESAINRQAALSYCGDALLGTINRRFYLRESRYYKARTNLHFEIFIELKVTAIKQE